MRKPPLKSGHVCGATRSNLHAVVNISCQTSQFLKGQDMEDISKPKTGKGLSWSSIKNRGNRTSRRQALKMDKTWLTPPFSLSYVKGCLHLLNPDSCRRRDSPFRRDMRCHGPKPFEGITISLNLAAMPVPIRIHRLRFFPTPC